MAGKKMMAEGTDTTGGFATKKPYGNGAMVALRFPDGVSKQIYADTKGIKGALPADDLHVTLAYLGESADIEDEARDRIRNAIKGYAATAPPLEGGRLDGTGTFKMGDYGRPYYANLQAKGLYKMREGLVGALTDAGVKMADDRFMPHATLAYLPEGTQTPQLDMSHEGLSFGSMYLKFGDGDYEEFKLGGEVKAADLSGTVESVQNAWRAKMRERYGDNWWDKGYQVDRVLDDSIITKKGGQTFRCPYVVDEGRVRFGDPEQVAVQYIPVAGGMSGGGMEYKLCKPEHARKMFMKMMGDESDNRVLDVADGNIIYENDGKCYRRRYRGDGDDVTFGEPVQVKMTYEPMEDDETKAGRRLGAPRVSQLEALREKLTDVVAALSQVLNWAQYMDGTGKSFPDNLNLDLLAEWAEEAAALKSVDIPPMYLKAVKETENGIIVGGYMMPWGSPVRRDLQLDYATPETKFYLDHYNKAPALFHHGKDPRIGRTILGHRDDARKDADGLWVQDWLDKSGKFWGMVKALLEKRALFYSPGAVPHLVERTPQRQLKAYPIADDTFTPTPVLAPLLGAERSLDYVKSAYAEAGIELTFPAGLRGMSSSSDDMTSDGMSKEQQLALAMMNLQKEALSVLT
jgi:2'-5' RNA ligase